MLRTTNLRSWIAADAKHLHHTIFIKTANSVCRGAGDSHLPQPSCSFPRRRFQPLTDEERSSESRRGSASPQGISPVLSNLILQVLATERIGPLQRGDFVLRTTNLRSWIAADATHLHHTIFIKTANSVCRGAGDSHLPRSLRARSPHVLSPRRRFHRLRTRNEVPRADGTAHHSRDSAGALELDRSRSRH